MPPPVRANSSLRRSQSLPPPPKAPPAGSPPPAKPPAGSPPPAKPPTSNSPPAQPPAGNPPPAQPPAGKTPPAQPPAGKTPPAQPPAGNTPPTQPPAGNPPPSQPPQRQSSGLKVSQPLDAFGHSSVASVPAGAAGLQFGVVGPDYKMPAAPAGATVHKPEKEFDKSHALVDSDKLKVKAGPQGKVEAEYFKHSAPGTLQVQGQAEAQGKLLSAEGKHTWQNGLGEGQVKGEAFVGAKASAEGTVLMDKQNGRAAVHGKVEGVAGAKAEVEAQQQLGKHGFVAGKAEGTAGAWGKAVGTAALDPKHGTAMFKAGGEGFAGVEAKAQGHAQMGPVGVSGGIGAKAGVGGNFGIGAGMQSGRFEFNTDLGGAVGCGMGCGLGMVIDFKRMGKGLKKLFHHSPPAQQQPPPANP
jgi:hypothetical protein